LAVTGIGKGALAFAAKVEVVFFKNSGCVGLPADQFSEGKFTKVLHDYFDLFEEKLEQAVS
jgi:hypothetical protein